MLIGEIKKRGKMHMVRLKDMQNLFEDCGGLNKNQEIYRTFTIERKELSYTLTVMKTGKINGEFFMTKGHTHEIPSSEVYYPLKGKGILLIQKGNSCMSIKMQKGKFYEIPEGYAHRTINIGNSTLEVLNIYPTKSGHNYKIIEKRGFKKRFY